MCKLDVHPWEDSDTDWIEIDDIFTNLVIILDLPKPFQAQRIQMGSYEKIFYHRTKIGENAKRIFIQGEAGTGKSTLALKLAHDWASRKHGPLKDLRFLFLLRMRDLERTTNLEDAIKTHLFSADCNITNKQLFDWIIHHQKECCIIFDGYDEASFSLQKKKAGDGNIIDILLNNVLRNCTVIVTSRPAKLADFGVSRKSYTLFEVTGFSTEDVNKYIYKFFGEQQKKLADELLKFIETNSMKIGVVSTPLITQLLCLYWQWCKGDNMPTSMTQLQNALFYFMKEHHVQKGGKDVDIEDIVSKLGKIALNALWPPNSHLVFDIQDIVKESSESTVTDACLIGLLKSRKVMMFGKEQTTSPLPFITKKKPSIEFYHKTGQEACAGDYLTYLHNKQSHEFKAKMDAIDTVQKALDLKLVLLAACGISEACTEKILQCLLKVYHQELEPKMTDYIKGKLDVEFSRQVQQLIELCLQCSFDGSPEGNFSQMILPLFPNGHAVFTGMSAQTAVAFQHMASHLKDPTSIKVLHVNGVPKVEHSSWGEDDDFDTLCDNVWKIFHDATGQQSESQLNDQLQGYNVDGDDLSKAQLFQVFESWEPETTISVGILCEALRHTQLTTVNFRNLRLGSESRKLFNVIGNGHLSSLEQMNLGNTALQDEEICHLAQVIPKLHNLRTLAINKNKADKSLIDLAAGLTRIKMCVLHFSGLNASAYSTKSIFARLPEMSTNLTDLWMDENEVNEDGVHLLCNFLQNTTCRLEKLSLSGCTYTKVLLRSCQRIQKLGITEIEESASSIIETASKDLQSYGNLKCLWLWCIPKMEEDDHLVHQKASDAFLATLKTLDLHLVSLGHMCLSRSSLQDLITFCRVKGVKLE